MMMRRTIMALAVAPLLAVGGCATQTDFDSLKADVAKAREAAEASQRSSTAAQRAAEAAQAQAKQSADAAAAAEMQRRSGQTKAPVLDWSGEILADFGAAELEPFLAQRGQ